MDAKNLISNCLNMNVEKRFSTLDILSDKALKKNYQTHLINPKVLGKLSTFAVQSFFM